MAPKQKMQSVQVPSAPDTAYRYATPGKNQTRWHWAQFLGRGKSSAALRDAHVLFFPAEQALELPLYDALGIPRSNLHGVEYDRATAAAIRKARYGFPLTVGTCTQFLKERGALPEPDRFLDAAWLDYDGSFHTFQEDIVATVGLLRPTGGACLGITSYTARDRATVLDTAIGASILRSVLAPMQFQLLVDSLSRQLAGERPPTDPAEAMSHYSLIGRELSLILLLVRALGTRVGGPAFAKEIQKLIVPARQLTRAEMQKRNHRDPENRPYPIVLLPMARTLFETTEVNVWPTDLLRFSYISPPASRVNTWYLRFEYGETQNDKKTLLECIHGMQRLWISRRIHLYDLEGRLERSPVHCAHCGM